MGPSRDLRTTHDKHLDDPDVLAEYLNEAKESGDVVPSRIAVAALQGFFHITERWELTDKQQRILLGEPEEFDSWKSNRIAKQLDENILVRISYILRIYKALRIMHSDENQRLFLKNATECSPFNGKSPLELMFDGDLKVVRRYLDGQLQAPYA